MAASRQKPFGRFPQWSIFKRTPGLVLGFHGCDKSVAEKVLAGTESLEPSRNAYDWLGEGIYFWESDPWRAMQFAESAVTEPILSKGLVKTPYVIGAAIDLGLCCNLMEQEALIEVREAHDFLEKAFELLDKKMPENKGKSMNARFRDKAVLEAMHRLRARRKLVPYDTMRSVFWEGEPLYYTSGFNDKNHVQIAVRNPECIRAYFRLPGL